MMADPLSALGLASNLVQLIAFASDLISKSHEIYKSADGALVENLELETITTSLKDLSLGLIAPFASGRTPSAIEKQLQTLCDGCDEVSKELLQVIHSLKSAGPNVRWNSFRQALRSVWKESKIESLTKRLEQYRRQIDTTLLVSLKLHIEEHGSTPPAAPEGTDYRILDFIEESKAWRTEILKNLERNDWQEKNANDMVLFSSQLTANIKNERDALIKSRIMEKLRFTEMNDRIGRIPTAYRQTFEWVFGNDSKFTTATHIPRSKTSSGKSTSRKKFDPFVPWLRSKESLYWITGKPGSGKSTLMKYLFKDDQTSEHLATWSQGAPLTKAGFFFWNSGSEIQMSKTGLFRSLLYQAISKRLDIIPSLFPDRWRYSELFGDDPRPWTLSEIKFAFETLISDDSRKFIFFVDGADEFEGDEGELAEFFLGIVSKNQSVKICVASRPWLVFEDAFQSCPSLRMEDLSASDIHIFVLGKLRENQMFRQLQELQSRDAERLILEVTEKACGVFLWVHLVIKSLLEGLRDGDSIKDLQERLLHLPSDLEELFKKILGILNPLYMQQAAKLFKMVEVATRPLSLLTLSFADDGLEKAISAEMKTITPEEKAFRAETTRRRLISRCKGFLEASTVSRVEYLHRTVKDFLRENHTRVFEISENDSDDANIALCGAFLRRTKTMELWKNMNFESFWRAFTTCIVYSRRFEHTSETAHVTALDELDRVMCKFFDTYDPKKQSWLYASARERRTTGSNWPKGKWSLKPYHDFVLEHSLTTYMRHRLNSYEEAETQRFGHLLLRQSSAKGDIAMTKLLLEYKINPNHQIEGLTNWEILLGAIENPEDAEFGILIKSGEIVDIVRLFLEHDADPGIISSDTSRSSVADIITKAFQGLDEKKTNQLFALLPKTNRKKIKERKSEEEVIIPQAHESKQVQPIGKRIGKEQLGIQERETEDGKRHGKTLGVKSRLHKLNSLFRTKI